MEARQPGREPPRWDQRRQHVPALIQAALAAVDPAAAVRRQLAFEAEGLRVGDRLHPLTAGGRVFLVGAGKAGVAMGRAAAGILGSLLERAVMAVPQAPADAGDVEWIEAGHPLPTDRSVAAGRRIRDVLAAAGPSDLVVALISGGGSALLELPVEGVSLGDLRDTTQSLLKSGATIHEINAVRHQLSQIKGGGLARLAAPAPVVTLLLSDVVGDDLEIIASGPTVLARADPAAARAVIERYSLASELPDSVRTRFSALETAPAPELPPPSHVIVGSNRMAAAAAEARASELGFRSAVLTTFLEGEAREVGRVLAALAKSVREHHQPLAPPTCLILGGETTVHVTGAGVGGRNQELALAAAISLAGWERCLVAAFGTDGIDGPTPAAGAVVSGETAATAAAQGLDLRAALKDNDSHSALSALGETIEIGPTGTNVNDLALLLVY